MNKHYNTVSFERLVNEWLPASLAEAFDLVEYEARTTEEGTCSIRMAVSLGGTQVGVEYDGIPAPRADGSFVVDGTERAIVMMADRADLETARISCVGEQLMQEIGPRLVAPPEGVEPTGEMLKTWLPLDKWIREYVINALTSSVMDCPNWLARQAYLRRLALPEDDAAVHPSHLGRVCPFETPEGPNCGRILHLARGARVRDGRLIPAENLPGGALGLTAGMAPLLEHNDGPRQLMGVNMMRQWLALADEEPALVRTGNEPDIEGFWAGRNLLTAYVHWHGLNYEDAIVLSESGAQKLASPEPLLVGDKLSNRHGAKGVVGAILPDSEMPHMPDGRAVELAYDFLGCHTRLNFGQILEAVLGLVAHATGKPAIAPPFGGPARDEIRQMLKDAGLPEDGQMRLTEGSKGAQLAQPSTVGYVYWGKTVHCVQDKLHSFAPRSDGATPGKRRGQRAGELEFYALQACDATENILENLSTRSIDRGDVDGLGKRLAGGPLGQAEPPTPGFARAQQLLRVAGIEARCDGATVDFSFARPGEGDLQLALPVPHPWCPQHELTHVGRPDEAGAAELERANKRAAQLLPGQEEKARQGLAAKLRHLLDPSALRQALRPGSQVAFTGRSVITPGPELNLGQVGLPEEMCRSLLEPLVARRMRVQQVTEWTPAARDALSDAMGENLVLLHRAPATEPTSITAFEPVLCTGLAIKLHPLCCRMFNADFDGDQMAVSLPITESAQQEAREKLTLQAHLERDPGTLLAHLAPTQGMLFGLAWALACPDAQDELSSGWPSCLGEPPRQLTRHWLIDELRRVLEAEGPQTVLETLQQLMQVGHRLATVSGASLHPFIGAGLKLPAPPAHRHPMAWTTYCEAVESAMISQADLCSPDMGPQMIAVLSGARGSLQQLRQLIGPKGTAAGHMVTGPLVRGGMAQGMQADEQYQAAFEQRKSLQALSRLLAAGGYDLRDVAPPKSDSVLAWALRARRPEEVLAQAALDEQTDPLTDPAVRLIVGLRP